eukprot:TRINITY_DN10842_c0_g1_i1.p1 TRINITY_DN10842_c0_g1~~TRINITY_DN10842_c0_g1_i1.p1  ORF type:complete len:150 (+),score=28.92 TRINITY_DN10842_c0_g1_i1:81-530(+)
MGLGIGGALALISAIRLKGKVSSGISLYGLPPLPLFLSVSENQRKSDNSLPVPLMILLGEDDKVTGATDGLSSYTQYLEAAKTTDLYATLAVTPKQTHGFMNFSISNKRRRELGMAPYEHEVACSSFQLVTTFLLDTLCLLYTSPSPRD